MNMMLTGKGDSILYYVQTNKLNIIQCHVVDNIFDDIPQGISLSGWALHII
jgi:hypothetical protein